MLNSIVRRSVFCFGLLLLLGLAVPGFAQQFQEGTDYERLPKEVPTSDPDKIEVVEVFWYGCPHCFSLEPQVDNWLKNKPENVVFVRIPTALGRKQWQASTRAFYAAEKLGIQDSMHKAIMDAVHVDKRPLSTEEQLRELFVEHGVDGEAFSKAFNSFAVETKTRRAHDLMRRYRVTSVPTLIVNGKYKMSGSFAVVNYLIAQESGS